MCVWIMVKKYSTSKCSSIDKLYEVGFESGFSASPYLIKVRNFNHQAT